MGSDEDKLRKNDVYGKAESASKGISFFDSIHSCFTLPHREIQ